MMESRYVAMFKRMRQYIRDGIAAGSIRPVESTAATLGLIGSMQWSFNWLRTVPMEQFDQVVEDACDLITLGIAAADGDPEFGEFDLDASGEPATGGFDRDEQNRLKQEAFFKTGTWFFNKKGFVGTSLDEIAETLKGDARVASAKAEVLENPNVPN